jgi:ATP-binding cassette subfamily B protein
MFGYLMVVLFDSVSQVTVKNIRMRMYSNMQANDMDFFDHNRTGDLMTRMTGDLDMVRHSIAGITRQLLNSVILFFGSLIFFFFTDWLFTLCVLAMTPIIFFVSNYYSRNIKPMYRGLRERMTELNTAAQENISGNKVIKAFAREEHEISKFDEKNSAYRDTNIRVNLYWMKFFPVMEMVANSLTMVLMNSMMRNTQCHRLRPSLRRLCVVSS